ncbi:MAG: CBS domain-containing protein [Deltaproteobacteria bacterium]|nr:CBS domain-containing protein [Deltaproteobacteria bacterium]MBW1990713.1 CBS domain-containing protein [Deltaproteobacteria bacterium]
MNTERLVREIMIPLTDYPHIPYWFSVREAIAMLKAAAADPTKKVLPYLVLVFDEKYQLLGYLGIQEMLRGIEPRFLKTKEIPHFLGPETMDMTLGTLWKDLFTRQCKEEAKKPVREVMAPIRATSNATDPIVKAAFIMLHTDTWILPVMEEKKVAGIVRLVDIFKELTAQVLEV